MKYVLLIALLLVGCGDDTHKLTSARPTVAQDQNEKPAEVVQAIVTTPPVSVEPEISDEEKAAQEEQDWVDAKAALARLSSQDISDLDLEDTEKNVRAHFAAKKLTDREKDVLGVKD